MIKVTDASETRLLWTVALAVVVYRVWNLPAYPLHEDETATIAAMKSIVETGLPITDTGQLYWRALLAHYVMALPLLFMDVSEYSVRLIPAVASGAVLPLAHRMCLGAGDRIAGWIAVAFLAASAFQDHLAAFARHYSLFQLAFCATIYFAARFFVDRSSRAGPYLLGAAVATVGTHQLSVEIGIVCAVALVVGGRYELLRTWTFWAGVATLLLATFIATGIPVLLAPSWVFVNHLATPLRFAGMADKSALYTILKSYLPVGLSFAVAGLIPIVSSERKVWRFYLLTFAGCMLLVSFTAPAPVPRYISNLFPLGVVSAALAVGWLLRGARELWSARDWREARRRMSTSYPLTCLVFALHLGLAGDWSLGGAVGRQLLAPDQRPHHEYIEQHLREGDLLISLEPGLTRAYLGRLPDFFLREKRDRDRRMFVRFSALEKSSSSIPVIDSPRLLAKVVEGHPGRIWVYLNRKARGTISHWSLIILRERFSAVYSTSDGIVLLRRSAEPSRPE